MFPQGSYPRELSIRVRRLNFLSELNYLCLFVAPPCFPDVSISAEQVSYRTNTYKNKCELVWGHVGGTFVRHARVFCDEVRLQSLPFTKHLLSDSFPCQDTLKLDPINSYSPAQCPDPHLSHLSSIWICQGFNGVLSVVPTFGMVIDVS